ncbi:amidohydrolase [Pseudomonas saudimassiliensis]|uniref:Amidohydrolase n=1 Tax=Pseudomonas saudimassiliensis TaxID=1461581 RepID=A0A078MA79_9PSED|nr:amidohydrolase [Pseudomonas saudimassiliensis]CEA04303.1 amidohydrolase [Pseudomonas saudimassiliensis]CEF26521.1 amidohydrolase [Pseudomonas saudimassiliensis]
MSILIRNATILAMDSTHGSTPFTGDLLIEGDSIREVGDHLLAPPDATVIDGTGKLVMPGLINSHLHSGEALFKGRYDNLPLELWMLYSYPVLGTSSVDERIIYLRSMLVAIEALKTGTTCITDDLFESPAQTLGQLNAAVEAYDDIGIRATVSGHMIDKPYLDTIPFSREFLPASCQAQLDNMAPPSADEFVDFAKAAYQEFHGRSGRIRFMVAPSAPQRCSDTLLQAADELARQWQVPFHTHIVETKVQGCTGPALYGKTLVQHMYDLGILHSGVTIAHSVWVTDRDIELMGNAGVSVVHNVISNQKLGAGIAPVRKLLDAGVNLALGTDGICSNDSARMFDVMKAAGLLHNVSTPNYERWLNASEVIHAATVGGARSALIDNITGSLEVGKRADLLILDMQSVNFMPLNDIRNHLVYCENGSSIEKVIVNGEIVVDNGKLTRIDEAAILAELRALMPAFLAYHTTVEQENAALAEGIAAIHRHCNQMDIGIHRLGTDTAWN